MGKLPAAPTSIRALKACLPACLSSTQPQQPQQQRQEFLFLISTSPFFQLSAADSIQSSLLPRENRPVERISAHSGVVQTALISDPKPSTALPPNPPPPCRDLSVWETHIEQMKPSPERCGPPPPPFISRLPGRLSGAKRRSLSIAAAAAWSVRCN